MKKGIFALLSIALVVLLYFNFIKSTDKNKVVMQDTTAAKVIIKDSVIKIDSSKIKSVKIVDSLKRK